MADVLTREEIKDLLIEHGLFPHYALTREPICYNCGCKNKAIVYEGQFETHALIDCVRNLNAKLKEMADTYATLLGETKDKLDKAIELMENKDQKNKYWF